MEGGGAYGAGKATGQFTFDPIAYIKKPQVILRAVSWLFSIIVFGCIASQGYYKDICLYNGDANACNYGITIGVLAFLGLTALLIVDAVFENVSSVQQRKYFVLADLGFSGLWTFLWFVGFCLLTDKWRKTAGIPDGIGKSGVEAAIAFSFFSIGTFGGLTALAVLKYRKGVSEQFASEADQAAAAAGGANQSTPSPYSAYPSGGMGAGESGDPYQQAPPFSQQTESKPGDFQPPTY